MIPIKTKIKLPASKFHLKIETLSNTPNHRRNFRRSPQRRLVRGGGMHPFINEIVQQNASLEVGPRSIGNNAPFIENKRGRRVPNRGCQKGRKKKQKKTDQNLKSPETLIASSLIKRASMLSMKYFPLERVHPKSIPTGQTL